MFTGYNVITEVGEDMTDTEKLLLKKKNRVTKALKKLRMQREKLLRQEEQELILASAEINKVKTVKDDITPKNKTSIPENGALRNSEFTMSSAKKNIEMSDSDVISEEESAFEDFSPRARKDKNIEIRTARD